MPDTGELIEVYEVIVLELLVVVLVLVIVLLLMVMTERNVLKEEKAQLHAMQIADCRGKAWRLFEWT
ncbi:MAG TPA: hypothetical protein DGS69_06750 [Acinetobacter baumannii]|nr:hypothetical protein [Acinetobacter baumannii]